MSLCDDLKNDVKEIFLRKWETRDGYIVPDDESLRLGNDGVNINGAVLYTDLADSTSLVDSKNAQFASEVYKAFLRTASRLVINEGGNVTAFDGDRVMGVFIGEKKESNAVKAALKINWAVHNIINPALRSQYGDSSWTLKHGTGVDSSNLLVSKSGIRNANDLVWVGPAANYAAKLSALRVDGFATWISQNVFEALDRDVKYDSKSNIMWEAMIWNTYNRRVYRSNYWWKIT